MATVRFVRRRDDGGKPGHSKPLEEAFQASTVHSLTVVYIACKIGELLNLLLFVQLGSICMHITVRFYCALSGLDIGLWQPLARGASESENPLAPQKTHWPPKNM